ncbi:MAG TPA: MFS transporter [Rhizomicrobium sp.]|jgi:SHS family lactate transporter-like MFS transporter|nr:MFS transporter [Rhizomicrobium sp.]
MAFLRGWTPRERHAVIASYLCWALDAFDYFVLVFVLTDVAQAFHAGITAVALALTLTLAFRPLGAFIFGRLADRYGRRPVLMVNVALYSLFGFLTAFSPSLITFLAIRSLFGMAMGGVWGIGASLAFETITREKRGFVSGLMQSGYATGYLAASLVFGFLYAWLGWRGLFMVGILPAFFLIFYIWSQVSEAPGWNLERARASTTFSVLKTHWRLALFAVVMMTAFNFFSHGTQDLYPTFLQKQHHFDHATVSTIAILYNIAAIMGGLTVGSLSQRFGRKRASVVTALIAVPVAFLWAFSSTAALLALGAILMQFLVQGAWGVVPAHLNEISPAGARGTFPGTVYQLGNLIASVNAVLQTSIAERTGGNYAIALASVAIVSVLVIALFMGLGPQAQDVEMV